MPELVFKARMDDIEPILRYLEMAKKGMTDIGQAGVAMGQDTEKIFKGVGDSLATITKAERGLASLGESFGTAGAAMKDFLTNAKGDLLKQFSSELAAFDAKVQDTASKLQQKKNELRVAEQAEDTTMVARHKADEGRLSVEMVKLLGERADVSKAITTLMGAGGAGGGGAGAPPGGGAGGGAGAAGAGLLGGMSLGTLLRLGVYSQGARVFSELQFLPQREDVARRQIEFGAAREAAAGDPTRALLRAAGKGTESELMRYGMIGRDPAETAANLIRAIPMLVQGKGPEQMTAAEQARRAELDKQTYGVLTERMRDLSHTIGQLSEVNERSFGMSATQASYSRLISQGVPAERAAEMINAMGQFGVMPRTAGAANVMRNLNLSPGAINEFARMAGRGGEVGTLAGFDQLMGAAGLSGQGTMAARQAFSQMIADQTSQFGFGNTGVFESAAGIADITRRIQSTSNFTVSPMEAVGMAGGLQKSMSGIGGSTKNIYGLMNLQALTDMGVSPSALPQFMYRISQGDKSVYREIASRTGMSEEQVVGKLNEFTAAAGEQQKKVAGPDATPTDIMFNTLGPSALPLAKSTNASIADLMKHLTPEERQKEIDEASNRAQASSANDRKLARQEGITEAGRPGVEFGKPSAAASQSDIRAQGEAATQAAALQEATKLVGADVTRAMATEVAKGFIRIAQDIQGVAANLDKKDKPRQIIPHTGPNALGLAITGAYMLRNALIDKEENK